MNVVHSELYTRASCSAIPEPKELKAPDPEQEEGECAIAKHRIEDAGKTKNRDAQDEFVSAKLDK